MTSECVQAKEQAGKESLPSSWSQTCGQPVFMSPCAVDRRRQKYWAGNKSISFANHTRPLLMVLLLAMVFDMIS
jgi:hypothetical protein